MWLGTYACESEIESLSNEGSVDCFDMKRITLMLVRGRVTHGDNHEAHGA